MNSNPALLRCALLLCVLVTGASFPPAAFGQAQEPFDLVTMACKPGVPEPCVHASPGFRLSNGDDRLAEYLMKCAKASSTRGLILLKVTIGRDGAVSDVVRKQGVDSCLDEQAMKAVRLRTYTPALYQGVPVAVLDEVKIHFTGNGWHSGTAHPSAIPSRPPFISMSPEMLGDVRTWDLDGEVRIRATITAQGKAQDMVIPEGIDKGPAKRILRDVKSWKFYPMQDKGIPLDCKAEIVVTYDKQKNSLGVGVEPLPTSESMPDPAAASPLK